MVPESELDCRYSMLSGVSAASCDGMSPERELDMRSSALTLPVPSQVTPCHVEVAPLHGLPLIHPALLSHVAPLLAW